MIDELTTENEMKHKHADVLIAIAEGKEVQWRPDSDSVWFDSGLIDLAHASLGEFRIKPEPKIEVRYFQRVTSYKATAFNTSAAHAEYFKYIEFEPDLEKWDLKITYQDGKEIKVEGSL